MTKLEKAQSFYEWTQNQPESMDSLCDFISDGGTLQEYCRENNLKYRLVMDWIDSDQEKGKEYDKACKARDKALQDRVLSTLRNAAEVDPRNLYDAGGALLHPNKMSDDMAHSLTEVVETENVRSGEITRKIKFTPRHSASMDLGKHLGMFREKVELTGKDGAPLTSEPSTDAVRRIAFALERAARNNQPIEETAS